MLPAHLKLRSSQDFKTTMRRGRAARSRTLMVHVLVPGLSAHARDTVPTLVPRAPRFGLVVSKAVGNAVARHATSRRLRHCLAALAATGVLPPGSQVVIRAFPPSATATSAELAADLERAVAKALARGPQ
ncbi:ribonuclease P protein component [Corynebacterium sp. 13CS0277]|uniref:ribonuclease P protein component n=1 Tax=Corynebacterium sp. 13CS0277 TaxID=2071994 RepID=UPI000D027D0B|nr:ribonuclease P protein component [Corynebacterium sp. 13CS0277]PRQ11099.1 ribonuclease P protein component [Corynebacterium sp. 13CS0277]